MGADPPPTIDEYIDGFEPRVRTVLQKIRRTVAAPPMS